MSEVINGRVCRYRVVVLYDNDCIIYFVLRGEEMRSFLRFIFFSICEHKYINSKTKNKTTIKK